jgi:hypothetical protein
MSPELGRGFQQTLDSEPNVSFLLPSKPTSPARHRTKQTSFISTVEKPSATPYLEIQGGDTLIKKGQTEGAWPPVVAEEGKAMRVQDQRPRPQSSCLRVGVQIELSSLRPRGPDPSPPLSDPGTRPQPSSLRPRGPGPDLLPQTQGCRPQPCSFRPRGPGLSLLSQTQGSRSSLLSDSGVQAQPSSLRHRGPGPALLP